MIVGITGGIGSGKSTIARALAARGFDVYDCDKEAKRIIAENKDVQQQIIALLGPEAFTTPLAPSLEERAGGEVSYNTAYVAQRVFAEPELLARLNAIVHPAVKADILQRSPFSPSERGTGGVLFIESAILYEAGLDELCDRIIIVDAPEEVRLARTIARDYRGEDTPEHINKVRARIRAQKNSAGLSDPRRDVLTILNDGTRSVSDLAETILAFIA